MAKIISVTWYKIKQGFLILYQDNIVCLIILPCYKTICTNRIKPSIKRKDLQKSVVHL